MQTGQGQTAQSNQRGVTSRERDRSLRVSVIDGCFHGGMVGFGENYVGAYVVFLGATATQAAAFGSWPALAGALFGAWAVDVVDRVGKRRGITVGAAAIVGLMYAAFAAIPQTVPGHAVVAAIVCWLVATAAGNVCGPAWNSWMGDLVPPEKRGAYFGMRSGLIAIVTFATLAAAGEILQHYQSKGQPARGWLICLTFAATCKFVSVAFLSRMAEPRYERHTGDLFTFRQFIARSPDSNFAWFTYGIALMWFCVHLSGPFFALYQFRELGWTPRQFMLSSGTQVLVFFLTQPWWGRFGDRHGSRRVLLISGTLCALLPILWVFTRNFYVILAIQVLAGFCWGGFNLATSNFLFEAVTPPKRARCAAYFNVVTALGIFVGALTGGWIVNHAPSLPVLTTPFLFVFALSGVLRFPVVLLWLYRVQDGAKAHVELRERARQLAVAVKGDPGDSL